MARQRVVPPKYISLREGDKYDGKISWLKNPNDEGGKAKVLIKIIRHKAKQAVPLMGLGPSKKFYI